MLRSGAAVTPSERERFDPFDLPSSAEVERAGKDRSGSPNQGAPHHDRVRRMISERNARSSFFGDSLFAEPAWDMLLDLYCAHLAQQRACVTSVCAASPVPLSTAVRWLKALEGQGLVSRSQDPLDSRRFFVCLTPQGLEKMTDYLEAVATGA